MREFERKLTRLKADIAAERFWQAALRVQRLLKYNPNWHLQPRVPAGNPDGGQWIAYLLGAAASVLPILQRLGSGAIRRLREEAQHARPLLRRMPKRWGSDEDFPQEDQFDRETQRIAPPSLHRPTHAFIRFRSEHELRRYVGPAGPGHEWHHIVEKRLAGRPGFPVEMIHATDNIINLPVEVHTQISRRMSSRDKEFGGDVRRFWVERMTFSEQYNHGLELIDEILEEFGYDPDQF